MTKVTSWRFLRRRWTDRFGWAISLLAVALAILPLLHLIVFIFQRGASSITLSFFTEGPGIMGQSGGGMYPMIVGTLILIACACVVGVPIGLLSGIYLARRSNRFAGTVRFVTDVIAGIPSILAGVIAFTVFVLPIHTYSAYAGAIALALLMFPTVTRATDVALRAVPAEIREAALAVGAPEWKVLLRVLIPTAASGIVTAIVLGVARVAGETAPLLFTVAGNQFLNTDIFHGPFPALTLQIWEDSGSPYPSDVHAAFAGALILFLMIMLLNLAARVLTYRLTRRTRVI